MINNKQQQKQKHQTDNKQRNKQQSNHNDKEIGHIKPTNNKQQTNKQ